MHTLGFFCGPKTTRFMRIRNIFLSLFFLFLTATILPQKIHAQEKASGSSATLSDIITVQAEDTRVQSLRAYLNQFNSPLSQYANTFVTQADLYQLDWTMVAAISGVESTFGHQIPSPTCPNAWGWDVYGTQTMCFSSFDEGIRVISKGLREDYINKLGTDDIYSIGSMYAASPTWASHVSYFMNDIKNYTLRNSPLPISI